MKRVSTDFQAGGTTLCLSLGGFWAVGPFPFPMRVFRAHELPLVGEPGEAHHTHQACLAGRWQGTSLPMRWWRRSAMPTSARLIS